MKKIFEWTKAKLNIRFVGRSHIDHDFECLGPSLYVGTFMYQCNKCECLVYTDKYKKPEKLNKYYGDCA